MSFALLLWLAFALSMDAFAVSLTNGMCYRIPPLKNALSSGIAFGIAQGLMPLLGYLLGCSFSEIVEQLDHWLALILLCAIGGKMVYEALKNMKNPEAYEPRTFSYRILFVQAIATSIDALAVGVSLGALKVHLLFAIGTIALVTFTFCFFGVFIGRKCGDILKDKAELLGGLILMAIGIRIFTEHMGWHFG